jgi:hypothetical protein
LIFVHSYNFILLFLCVSFVRCRDGKQNQLGPRVTSGDMGVHLVP